MLLVAFDVCQSFHAGGGERHVLTRPQPLQAYETVAALRYSSASILSRKRLKRDFGEPKPMLRSAVDGVSE